MRDTTNHSVDIQTWIRLIRSEGVGPVLFHRLVDALGSPSNVLGASISRIAQIEGIGIKTAERLLASAERVPVEKELSQADKLGVWFLHCRDDRYPTLLKHIYDPPPVLSVKGSVSREHHLCLAIVGARRCSIYGQEQAAQLAHLLANTGFTIVSGMARGIDTAAHRGALSAGGQTIAVLGSGLANCYPTENLDLYERIANQGCCFSELPLTAEPLREHFPARNRIIAGLSLGTIIVEADLRSGAMITARLALENNREALAVPGRIDNPLSRGPHQLIRQGAVLVDSIESVIDALGTIGEQLHDHVESIIEEHKSSSHQSRRNTFVNLTPSEQSIYDCLSEEPSHTDDITVATSLPVGKVTADLVNLQLKGMVKSLPGNLFVRKS